MPLRDRFAWVLIAASALAAMVVGHAIELWLEGTHVFGERAASYRHVAQSAAAEAATILLLLVAAAFISRLFAYVSRRSCSGDRVLPALSAIASAGFNRVAPRLAVLQITALFAAEIGEQHLSGYQGNALVAIAGPGHATALFVQLLIALTATFTLCRFARFALMRSDQFVDAVIAFLRRALSDARVADFGNCGSFVAAGIWTRGSALLSLGLANRPPPAFATFA